MQSEMKNHRRDCEIKLSDIAKEHTAEFLLIDNKVRKTIQIRDETINLLREKLAQAERRQNEVEKILSDLNAGFSSSPMRPSSKNTR